VALVRRYWRLLRAILVEDSTVECKARQRLGPSAKNETGRDIERLGRIRPQRRDSCTTTPSVRQSGDCSGQKNSRWTQARGNRSGEAVEWYHGTWYEADSGLLQVAGCSKITCLALGLFAAMAF
jgi:hypothetical protein